MTVKIFIKYLSPLRITALVVLCFAVRSLFVYGEPKECTTVIALLRYGSTAIFTLVTVVILLMDYAFSFLKANKALWWCLQIGFVALPIVQVLLGFI